MKNKILFQLLVMFPCILATSCDDTWIMYDTSQRDHLYFEVTTPPSLSFALLSEQEIKFSIPVRIMGMPAGHDRTFSLSFLEAEAGETLEINGRQIPVATGRPGTDYAINELRLPAGAVEGHVALTIFRQQIMKEKAVSIHFRIDETDEFLPLAPDSSDIRKLLIPEFRLYVTDDDPLCPDWWDSSNQSDDLFGWTRFTGNFYPEKFRKMLDLYWQMESANPVFFETCVEKYGRNLDKEGIKDAFFITENPSAWATYVLIPLYEYYKAYYAAHPDDPNIETFANSGSSGTYWQDPVGLLR